MVRAAVATVILSAIALTAGAQTTVSGRVVADDTGDPIPNARVTVASTALETPVVLSDGEGRFTFTAPPGGAHIVASKSGYARRDVDPPIGSRPIEIRLRRGAAISGQVVDEFGNAVQSARVTAESVASASANPTVVATADTDDRGEYRLAGLPSGAVTVAVVTIRTMLMPRGLTNNQLVFSPSAVKTYYPGVPTPDRAQERMARSPSQGFRSAATTRRPRRSSRSTARTRGNRRNSSLRYSLARLRSPSGWVKTRRSVCDSPRVRRQRSLS